MSFGADFLQIARGFMMSAGCIRARYCSGTTEDNVLLDWQLKIKVKKNILCLNTQIMWQIIIKPFWKM